MILSQKTFISNSLYDYRFKSAANMESRYFSCIKNILLIGISLSS